ncbi:MAG: hypothetical protein EYC70_16870 [Planctomycetota bacterium]|nr:MAG: hypothetical protein EYC70_16870 [Planctomycetota bacterium]
MASTSLRFLLAAVGLAAACGGEEAPASAGTGGAEQDAAAPQGPPPDPGTYGTIAGVVKFEGEVPPNPMEGIGVAPTCAAHHPGGKYTREWYLVRDGRVQNVLVYVQRGLPKGLAFEVPRESARLDQVHCVFVPHVLGMRVGQPLVLSSSDAEAHNVNLQSKLGQGINTNMAPRQTGLTHEFRRNEVPVLVTCDVHPWMTAFLGVFDHPYYAVTGADGTFRWDSVPPGEYTLRAWHEKLGPQEQKLTLAPNGSASVEYVYRAQ